MRLIPIPEDQLEAAVEAGMSERKAKATFAVGYYGALGVIFAASFGVAYVVAKAVTTEDPEELES